MARWTLLLLAVGLFCSTVAALSPHPEDYERIEGASPESERLRQGTVLTDYILDGRMCDATCNNEPFESNECKGTAKIRCSGSNATAGGNATFFSVIQCKGRWTANGWNDSEYMSVSKEGDIVCNGAFHQKSLFSVVKDGKSTFSVAEFGCAFMFSYQMTSMGRSMVDSSTCHGAAATKMMRSSEGNKTAVTRESMEALLNDVAGDDIDSVMMPDDGQEPYLDSVSDKPEVKVTCNGEEAVARQPCDGTLKIDVQAGNISIADECRGYWMPAPRERAIAGCSGDWTTDISGEHGEFDSSCVGHIVLSLVHVDTPQHHFHGSRSLCVGRHDTSSEYAGGYVRQGFAPTGGSAVERTDQKTTDPVLIS